MENQVKKARSQRIRALMLSGLICPGLGQLTLKRKKRAIALIALSIISLSLMIVKIFIITHQVMSPELMINLSLRSYLEAFEDIRSRAYAETWPLLLAFIGVWIGGLLDILLITGGELKPN